MEGRGMRCDNCGEIAFVTDVQSDGSLPNLFKRMATQRTLPDGWFVVAQESLDSDTQDVIQSFHHYCSTACLAFVANYTYQHGEIPTQEKETK